MKKTGGLMHQTPFLINYQNELAMMVSKYAFFFCIILFSCSNYKQPIKVKKKLKCDFIDTSSFNRLIEKNWPTRKPSSVADAVRLLDSIADDNFKCIIIKMNESELYFGLGLRIRNSWVRHGTEEIKNQLFYKLKVSNIDYSSGLIINIYREFLTNNKIDLVELFLKSKNDTSLEIKNELMKIQKELSK